ncbi:MAG TPA: hypothetical protein VGM06_04900 [Polyangiaceae bacterium]|jgi:hypothetical protein
MAYPNDPPNHRAASPAALAGSRLTLEDAEKLAATFRPSWELDDAPFAGAAAFSDAELHALRGGGGTQADMRGAVQALNGTHAPAPATVLENEPTTSVILGGGIDAEEPPTVIQRPLADPAVAAKAMSAPAASPVIASARTAPGVSAPTRRSVDATSGARVSASSEADRLPKRSRLGVWLGLGAAALGIAIGIWHAAGAGDKRDAAAPPVDNPTATTASPIPPPPPPAETMQAAAPTPPVQATATLPPPPPPAAVTAAEPPPRVAPPTPVAAAPPTPAPAPRPAATAHQTASWGGGAAPAPKAPARPKSPGTTIVRDVPF